MAQKRQREAALTTKNAAKTSHKQTEPETKTSETPKPKTKDVAEEMNLSDVSDSGIDDDDEFAAGQEDASASSSSESDKSDEESEDDSFPLKKKKKNTDDGRGTFADAFNAIIGSKLKAHDRKDPILVRNKGTIKKLESDKLEAKAKRLMSSEKKELQDKHRITNLLPSASDSENVREIIEKEKRLKKVAQKGVVKLFNAVLSTQVRTTHDVSQEKVGHAKKEELLNELTKSKFLDLVKAAGEE